MDEYTQDKNRLPQFAVLHVARYGASRKVGYEARLYV
jgi:hypothetical protein